MVVLLGIPSGNEGKARGYAGCCTQLTKNNKQLAIGQSFRAHNRPAIGRVQQAGVRREFDSFCEGGKRIIPELIPDLLYRLFH